MKQSFDVAIVGAGPGGYIAAIRAAQLGLKAICIDKRKELGGTCLNVGCIPSKALLQSSEEYIRAKEGLKVHGIETGALNYNFPAMMQRKATILSTFNQGIAGLFKKNRVTHLTGAAHFIDSHTLRVADTDIEAKYIILATGSEPIALPFLPFDENTVLSSTGALSLSTPPKHLLIIGAGVIGVELGSVYARLGSQVTFVEYFPTICPAFDPDISKELLSLLKKQGMQFHLGTKVVSAERTPTNISLSIQPENSAPTLLSGDAVLVSIGRRPHTEGLQLDKAGLTPTPKGFLEIDPCFRTKVPHIFAIGDLVDGPMLAHKASEEGCAVAELIAGHSPRLDYIAIPSVIYTHPEVASVGMTEAQAKSHNLSVLTGTFSFKANSRAKCASDDEGFVKVIGDSKTDKLLGIHILSAHASELISTAALAIHKRCTLSELAETPFAHPTLAEAIKEAALAAKGKALHK
jgi:dihydrolipoamide dehydrogenase